MTAEPISFSADKDDTPEEIVCMLQQALEDAQDQPIFDEPEEWPNEPPIFERTTTSTGPYRPADPIERLIEKVGQAYQVIGCFLRAEDVKLSKAEQKRVLDYYASETAYDPDFLPWPRHESGGEVQ